MCSILLPNQLIVIVFSGMCLKLINVAALIKTVCPHFCQHIVYIRCRGHFIATNHIENSPSIATG